MREGDQKFELERISGASIVAHEIRSPLSLIRQLSFELGDETLSSDDRQRLLTQIRLTSEQALRFSSNVAKAERLQAHLFPVEPVSPARFCQQIVNEAAPLYRARGRQLRLATLHARSATANHELLHRVVMNFVDNALEYTDETSVVELYTQLVRREEKIRVGVRSRGGVSRAAQSVRTETPRDSHGLGLIIAHRFAELFDGRIGAIRHKDGASFYVEVNLSKQLALL